MLHSDRNCSRDSGVCRFMNREYRKKNPQRMRAGLLFFLLFSWGSVFLCRKLSDSFIPLSFSREQSYMESVVTFLQDVVPQVSMC